MNVTGSGWRGDVALPDRQLWVRIWGHAWGGCMVVTGMREREREREKEEIVTVGVRCV